MDNSQNIPFTFAIKPLHPTISKTDPSINPIFNKSNKLLYCQDSQFCWMPNRLLSETLTCLQSFQMNSEIQVNFLKQHKKTLAFLFTMIAQQYEDFYQDITERETQSDPIKVINYEDQCQKIFSTLSLDKSQTQEFKKLAGSDHNIYRTYVDLYKVIPKRYHLLYTLSFHEALKFNKDLGTYTRRHYSVMSKKLEEKIDEIIEEIVPQCLEEQMINQSEFLFKIILTILLAINGHFQNSIQIGKHDFEHENTVTYKTLETKKPKNSRIIRRKKQNVVEEGGEVMKKRKLDDSS